MMARGASRARVLAALAAGAFALSMAAPEQAGAQTRTAAQAERDRRAETARAERLRAQAEAAEAELRRLDGRLGEAERRRSEAIAAAAQADARLEALRQQISSDEQRRLAAADAFERAVIAAALAHRRPEPRAARVATFARAAARDLHRTQRQASQLAQQGRRLEMAMLAERRTLAAVEATQASERQRLAQLADQRRNSQSRYVADAATAERRAQQFAAEARTLRQMVRRASATRPAGQSSAGGIPASWTRPLAGTVSRGFGARANGGAPSQGVHLRAAPGATVVAPAAGEITYAGPFRSYGQVLILAVDGGYAVLLTGMDALSVQVGQTVQPGQNIGRMPVLDTGAPELYVEVRRNDRLIDPGRWLTARGDAAARSTGAG